MLVQGPALTCMVTFVRLLSPPPPPPPYVPVALELRIPDGGRMVVWQRGMLLGAERQGRAGGRYCAHRGVVGARPCRLHVH